MKKVLIIGGVIIFLGFLFLIGKDSKNNDITVVELKEMLDSDYQFVDIRTEPEYLGNAGPRHIEEFDLNIDYYQFINDLSMLDVLDKNKPVVIICNSGNRTGDAVSIMEGYGFSEVYNVLGGITKWCENEGC